MGELTGNRKRLGLRQCLISPRSSASLRWIPKQGEHFLPHILGVLLISGNISVHPHVFPACCVMKSRCIEIASFGIPAEVVRLGSRLARHPGDREIQLRTVCAPINPADLNVMEGTYGTLPELPAVLGNESIGVVEAVGKEVREWEAGDVAMPIAPGGLWNEWLTLPEDQAVKLPKGIDLQQAAMLRVNPPTAWLLLHQYVRIEPGEWIVQNAGNSAVGMAVMQLAQARGWRVLNLVRREAAASQCREAGAEHVLVETEKDFAARAGELMGPAKARLALNAVGGESALRLANLLRDDGVHVTYGAMGRQKLSLPNRFLIFQQLTFTGFWLTRWTRETPLENQRELYQKLALEMISGNLHMPVEKSYPVEEIAAAVTRAQQAERSGKVQLHWPTISE